MKANTLVMLCLFAAGTAQADYTKIANNGWELPAGAVLGGGAFDWACTRDLTTGLVWEVKTDDGGLRDKDNAYTNFDDPDQPQKPGINPTREEIDAASNSIGYVHAVNTAGLCGLADWRRPTGDELLGLVTTAQTPHIDQFYFPNMPDWYLWSASPVAGAPDLALALYTSMGDLGLVERIEPARISLVSSAESISNVDLTITLTGSGAGDLAISGLGTCSRGSDVTWGTCTARPVSGDRVTLSVSVFAGSTLTWGGACAGTTGTLCSLTMDDAKSVTADFFMPFTNNADYTKIANNGWELPDSAVLGGGDNDWACTRDNITGLVWEVKTDDGGLRDKDHAYTNLDDPDQPQKYGVNPTREEIDAASNSIGFVNAVNAASLCGFADWRRPTAEELQGLVMMGANPPIDRDYFPNTPDWYLWSESPLAGAPDIALALYTGTGDILPVDRYQPAQVRLVRSGQAMDNVELKLLLAGTGIGSINIAGLATCSRGSGVTWGTCDTRPIRGSRITLSATLFAGSTLTWGGACAGTTGPSCNLTMDEAKTVSAGFSLSLAASALLADPDLPTTLYAGLDGGGVYVSHDSGGNWSAVANQPANRYVKALAKNSGTPLYAATYGGGVFKAITGTEFSACPGQPGNGNVLSLLLDAAGNLYAGTEGGVYLSTDQCASWSLLSNGLPN